MVTDLHSLRDDAPSGNLSATSLPESVSRLETKGNKIAAWAGRMCELATSEAAKQLGRSAADYRVWFAGWLYFSGQLQKLVETIFEYMR